MSLKRSILLILLAVIGITSAGYLLYWKQQTLSKAPAFRDRPRPVTVEQARQGEFVQTRSYLAEVESSQNTRLTSRVRARVVHVSVDEGDRVDAGEVLVKLDRREINQRIASLGNDIEQVQAEKRAQEADLKELGQRLTYWKKEVERYEGLVEKQSVSESKLIQYRDSLSQVRGNYESMKETVDALEHRIQSLRKKRAEARTRRDYHVIKSPYDARIAKRLIDTGDMASPERDLLRLEEVSHDRLVFDLPQTDVGAVQVGSPVRFETDETRGSAEISLLHTTYNENRMLRAEVRLPRDTSERFRSGEYVSVDVVLNTYPNAVHIPRTALIESPGGEPYVFVVQDGQLKSRSVEPLGSHRDRTAVNGLDEGETVVKHTFLGWTLLNSDQPVQPVRSP